jgi:hypothetical protein|tara:strand:+ start:445 stop:696 length:252 start_codon:yes stop_codon:yes gene_type:complete
VSRKIQADIRIPIEKVEKRLSTALGKKDITFLEQQLTQQLKTMEFDLIDALVVAFQSANRNQQNLDTIISQTIANIGVANQHE